MALTKITYDTKVALDPQPGVANANKVSDSDMNEIKSVVNNAIDQIDTNTTNISNIDTYSTNEIDTGQKWIDGGSIYRKVIHKTTSISLSSQSWTSIGETINNAQAITEARFLYVYNNKYYLLSVGAAYDNGVQLFNFRTVDVSANNWYAILEYTKTS